MYLLQLHNYMYISPSRTIIKLITYHLLKGEVVHDDHKTQYTAIKQNPMYPFVHYIRMAAIKYI